jgi:DUF4097 and DUF4098 domain-containing protein YvlB
MKSFSIEPGTAPNIELRVASGRADFYPGPEGSVEVDVTGSGAEFVVVEQVGRAIIIREERRLFGGRTVNIRVSAPPGSHLDASVASMDICTRGTDLGRVNLHTASGDIDLGTVDDLTARSASGDIKVDKCKSSCQASSASGDVRVHSVEGDFVVSTASGDILAERIEGRSEIKSASGDVRLGCCRGGQIELNSMSGDVSVGIPAGTRVEAQVDTLSGSVRFPPKQSGGNPTRSTKLRARTVSGDIEVRRVD